MSVVRRCVPLLALFASLGLAQSPTGILTGKLIDITGAGLANVRVRLTSEQTTDLQIDENTNGDGDFKFSVVPSGEYILRSFVPGFQTVTIKSIAIEAGGEIKLPTVQMWIGSCGGGRQPINFMRFQPEQTQTGGLSGRVQFPAQGNSAPVAGAEVKLLCSKGGICATTKTDHNGEFSFSNIYPGDVPLLVNQPGFYPQDMAGFRVESGWQLNYYPVYLEKCSPRDCDPAKRPKTVEICE